MFTNSGMMPFVPIFLGEEPIPFDPPRAVDVQKCVRAGGKHNDLDAIGRTPRHLENFFEMMGNWSTSDYFKSRGDPRRPGKCSPGVYGLDGDRMWATVYKDDDEAEHLWIDGGYLPSERVQRLDKDNFWEMGDVGPCGPSSEIFWDYGPDNGPDGGPANPAAEARYVEIWNLVFMELFRRPDGGLEPLPMKNVDTGAGLERTLAAINGVTSVFDTGVLADLVDRAQSVTGARLGVDDRTDVALKVIADHTRTMAFLIGDGVIPSNTDPWLRVAPSSVWAVRYAYLARRVTGEVTTPMISTLVELMGDSYPDLRSGADLVLGSSANEEGEFKRTLERGVSLLGVELEELPAGPTCRARSPSTSTGTYGFPQEADPRSSRKAGSSSAQAGYQATPSSRAGGLRLEEQDSACTTGEPQRLPVGAIGLGRRWQRLGVRSQRQSSRPTVARRDQPFGPCGRRDRRTPVSNRLRPAPDRRGRPGIVRIDPQSSRSRYRDSYAIRHLAVAIL